MPPLPKPPSCEGCPFQRLSTHYVPDEVRPGARVGLMFQNPGEDEEAGRLVRGGQVTAVTPAPLLGRTGEVMEASFLPLAGLTRDDVSLHNAIRCRLRGGNQLPPVKAIQTREAIAHCTRTLFKPPDSVRVWVAAGEYALYTLTGEGLLKRRGLADWRGWPLPLRVAPAKAEGLWTDVYTPKGGEPVVLPTYHIALIFRSPAMRIPVQVDWTKVQPLLRGTWPEPPPEVHYHAPATLPAAFAYDTEYDVETRVVHRYSVAWRDSGGAHVYSVGVGDCVDSRPIRDAQDRPRIVMQNAPADIPSLERTLGLAEGSYTIDDPMILHACLWADVGGMEADDEDGSGRHNLNFMGSLYAPPIPFNRWKHLGGTNEALYAGLDAIGTWDLMEALRAEMARDPGVRFDYEECRTPHLPKIAKRERLGLRLDRAHLDRGRAELARIMEREELTAQAAVGWPIRLASPQQVGVQLYGLDGVPEKRKRG